MEEFGWGLVKLIGLFGAAILVFAFVSRSVQRKWNFMTYLLLPVVHGALCIFLTLVFFHDSFGSLEDNETVFKLAQIFGLHSNEKVLDDEQMILVDNSYNKKLITDPYSNEEDSLRISVTDRRKLAELLKICADHKDQIISVVCDIRFEEETDDDAYLIEQMTKLAANDQLILAGGWSNYPNALNMGPQVFAAAESNLDHGKISHFVLTDGVALSLPYRLYLKAKNKSHNQFLKLFHTEKDAYNKVTWVRSSFTPGLGLTQKEETAKNEIAIADEQEVLTLGYYLSSFGKEELISKITNPSKKSIVFIGEFESARTSFTPTDKHATILGEEQGSRILLDVFYDLGRGAHRAFHWIFMLLWVFLSAISFFIFKMARKPAMKKNNNQGDIESNEKSMTDLAVIIIKKEIGKKVWDILKVLMLIVIILAVAAASGIFVNIAALLTYFVLLSSLFKGFKEQMIAKTGAK